MKTSSENRKRTWLFVVLLLIIIFLAWLVIYRRPGPLAPETPALTVGAPSTDMPVTSDTSTTAVADCPIQLETPQQTADADGSLYIKNHIIFTGLTDHINQVIDALNLAHGEDVIDPDAVWSIQLLIPGSTGAMNDIDIRLYETVPNDQGLRDAYPVINEAAGIAIKEKLVAIPEPNYVIGNPSDLVGEPGGGSSGIEGGPGGGSSGIEGGGEGGSEGAAPDFFLEQWAFTDGIGLYDTAAGSYMPIVRGAGVRVGVFDSSPLSTGYYETGLNTAGYPFDLCVTAALDDLQGLDPVSDAVTEHGYFAASLIQAVAPESDIHLVQVLDRNLVGNLGFLLHMMHMYLEAYEGASGNPHHVLNLSLGFELNFVEDLDLIEGDVNGTPLKESAGDACLQLVDLMNVLDGGPFDQAGIFSQIDCVTATAQLPKIAWDVFALAVNGQGHLIVAASGNKGADQPALAPASFDSVLGVGAANFDRNHSCFSNDGDVWAPGGNGGPGGCAVDLNVQCNVQTKGCNSAVIGRVTTWTYESGFAYWVGTSFATPMASGLANLIWGIDDTLSPDEVRALITSCAAGGIIDLQTTIDAAVSGLLHCGPPP